MLPAAAHVSEPAAAAPSGRSPRFWAILFGVSAASVCALKLTGAIDSTTGLILFAVSMALLIPMVRASRRRGCESAAMAAYNRRFLAAAFAYLLGLGVAIALWRNYELARPMVFAISLLPALPTLAMVWAMARYLTDEQDEYLRHRTVMAALVALGVVLAAGIFWGFLEMFALVPHVWAWWVLPVWAIALGMAQLWMKARGE